MIRRVDAPDPEFTVSDQQLMEAASRYFRWQYELAEAQIGRRVLEVGCGVGAKTEILLRRFPNIQLSGIDVNDNQVTATKTFLEGLPHFQNRYTIQKMDASNMEFQSNTFDGAFICWVLEHVPDPRKTLSECNRILKPNGVLVVNYPDIGSWLSRVMKSKWIFLLSIHLYYFTPKTIRAMLRNTGYKTVLIKPHFQRLSLGYLVYRTEAYSKFLHKIGKKLVNTLKMDNLQVPYWLGQTFVLARKK